MCIQKFFKNGATVLNAVCVFFHTALFYVAISINGQKSYNDHLY